MNKDMKGNSCG